MLADRRRELVHPGLRDLLLRASRQIDEPGGTDLPHFREATSYDPRYHVQHIALPQGSSYEDLLRLVADLHEPMLDRDRPLFRNWLIDGLPGDRFALYTKVHHAIIDGAPGTRRIHSSLSASARRTVPRPAFAIEEPLRKPRPPKALLDRLSELGITATRQTLALRDVSIGAIRKGISTLLGNDPRGTMAFSAHHGPMNEPLRMSRSLATLTLPLHEMHEVGRHYGATLNDLAVAIVDEGIHRYLRATGRTFPHRLVASARCRCATKATRRPAPGHPPCSCTLASRSPPCASASHRWSTPWAQPRTRCAL